MASAKRTNDRDKLTPKQARFVEEYLVDLCATQAAIRAGYSEKTAGPAASRLLANVKIMQALNGRMGQRSKRTEITQDFVLRGICQTMQRMEEAEDFGPAHAQAILRGQELLGRHLAMFTDKLKVDDARQDLDESDLDRRIGTLQQEAATGAFARREGSETTH